MKKPIITTLLLCTLLVSSCGGSMEKDIDNFFKEYAIEEYNNSEYEIAPFKRSVKTTTNSNLPFYYKGDGIYVSPITGNEIAESELVYVNIPGKFSNFSYFENHLEINNSIYDSFGNSCVIDRNYYYDNYQQSRCYLAFLSTTSANYKNIFHIDENANLEKRLAAVIIYQFGGKTFYRDARDNVFNFSFSTNEQSFEHLPVSILSSEIAYYSELNKFEYGVTFSDSSKKFYYMNLDDNNDAILTRSTKIADEKLDYDYLYNLVYSRVHYEYAVKKTDLTNDFDFFFAEDFAKAYGIELSAGNYKIYTTHMGKEKYFPLSVIPSANHDYLMALCLKIGENKMLEPNYYVAKISNTSSISEFSSEVELMQQSKFYLKLNESYVMLNSSEEDRYGDLEYLKQNFCYVLESQNKVYFDKAEYYMDGTLVSVIPETKTLFVSNEKSKLITKVSFDGEAVNEERYEYDKIINTHYALYQKGTKLYFQNEQIDEVAANASIECRTVFNCSLLGKKYQVIILNNKSHSEYIYIGCGEIN